METRVTEVADGIHQLTTFVRRRRSASTST